MRMPAACRRPIPAEHVAMPPAQQGLGIGVQAIIEPVLGGEEGGGQGRDATGVVAAGLDQRTYIAACTERLGPAAAQQHADDARIVGPGAQALIEDLDHRQVQGIERLGRIQGGDADARAIGACEYLALNGHGRPRVVIAQVWTPQTIMAVVGRID